MYDFEQLIKDISSGREIEFKLNDTAYSITNNQQGWQLAQDDELIVGIISDIDEFLSILINDVMIDGSMLKEIFNGQLYNQDSFYVL